MSYNIISFINIFNKFLSFVFEIEGNKFMFILDLKENITEVLVNLCQRHNVPSSKKLAYLNAIVKLISENENPAYGYSADELFCWQVTLLNSYM